MLKAIPNCNRSCTINEANVQTLNVPTQYIIYQPYNSTLLTAHELCKIEKKQSLWNFHALFSFLKSSSINTSLVIPTEYKHNSSFTCLRVLIFYVLLHGLITCDEDTGVRKC